MMVRIDELERGDVVVFTKKEKSSKIKPGDKATVIGFFSGGHIRVLVVRHSDNEVSSFDVSKNITVEYVGKELPTKLELLTEVAYNARKVQFFDNIEEIQVHHDRDDLGLDTPIGLLHHIYMQESPDVSETSKELAIKGLESIINRYNEVFGTKIKLTY